MEDLDQPDSLSLSLEQALLDTDILSQPESILPDSDDEGEGDESMCDFSFAAAVSNGIVKVEPDYDTAPSSVLSVYSSIVVSPSEPVTTVQLSNESSVDTVLHNPNDIDVGDIPTVVIKVEPTLGNFKIPDGSHHNGSQRRKEELKEKYKAPKRGRGRPRLSDAPSSSMEPKRGKRQGSSSDLEDPKKTKGNKNKESQSTRGRNRNKAEVKAVPKPTPRVKSVKKVKENVKSQHQLDEDEVISLENLTPVIVPKKINPRFKCRVRMKRMSEKQVKKYSHSQNEFSYSSTTNENDTSAWSPQAHYPSDSDNDDHDREESVSPGPSKKSKSKSGIFISRPTGISKKRRQRNGQSTGNGRRRRNIIRHTFTCEYCTKEFSVISGLSYHQNQVPVDPPHECKICKETFKLANCMNYHLENSHPNDVGANVARVIGVKGSDSDPRKKIICDECGKTFSKLVGLNLHKKQIHEEPKEIYTCEVENCGKTFARQNYLDDHMIVHKAVVIDEMSDKPFGCKECSAKFSRRSHLTIHVRTHQNIQPDVPCPVGLGSKDPRKTFTCEICSKGFTRYAGLTYHLKAIHSDNPIERKFSCPECNRTFISKGHLTGHLRLFPGKGADHKAPNPTHKCDVCGKLYPRAIELREHQRCHTGEKVKCRHCPAELDGLYLRSVHERDVHGAFTAKKKRYDNYTRRFKCPMGDCEKAFYTTSGYHAHIRSHTGEKPHMCAECGVSYKNSISLKEHTMSVHTMEKPLQCPHCPERFSRKLNMKYHILSNHTPDAKKYACDQCPLTFLKKGFLDVHLRAHSSERKFACHLCPARYKSPHTLTLHLRRCGKPDAPPPPKKKRRPPGQQRKPKGPRIPRIPKYPCTICGNLFRTDYNRKVHELTHSEQKDFKCSTCGKGFYTKAKLTTHEKRHAGILDYSCKICGKAFVTNDKVKIHMKTHMKNPERFREKKHRGQSSHSTSSQEEIYDSTSNQGQGQGYQFQTPIAGPSHGFHGYLTSSQAYGYGSRSTTHGQYHNQGGQDQALDFSDTLAQVFCSFGSGNGNNN